MKSLIQTSLAVLLCAHGTSYAFNPVPGWYGGVMIGVNYTPTANFNRSTDVDLTPYVPSNQLGSLTSANKMTYGTMGNIGGQLGYRFGKYRLEGQYFYNNSPYQSLSVTATKTFANGNTIQKNFGIYAPSTSTEFRLEGSTDSGLGMLNGFYDFLPTDPRSSVVPYIGLGIGYTYFSNNLRIYYNEVNIDAARVKESVTSPAGQIIIGTSYFLDDFASFSLDARYFTSSAKSNFLDSRLQVYTVNVSFNSAFNLA